MAWLRIDDGFAQHPKIVRLARGDRWTWLEILTYCARYRSGGEVPVAVSEVVKGATPAFLNRCFELHLLDHSEQGDDFYHVHDWEAYNPKDPTAAERMQRHRDRNASVTTTVTDAVTGSEQERNANGPSRAATRARPVPSPTPEEETSAVDAQQTTEEEDPDEPTVGGGLPPLGHVLKQMPT